MVTVRKFGATGINAEQKQVFLCLVDMGTGLNVGQKQMFVCPVAQNM